MATLRIVHKRPPAGPRTNPDPTHNLEVRPGGLHRRLLFLRVEVVDVRRVLVRGWGQRPEQVGHQHLRDVLKHRLVELARPGVDVVHQLQQRQPLHLLLPDVLGGVRKVKPEKVVTCIRHTSVSGSNPGDNVPPVVLLAWLK
jgi:hypothetical protein